jgi:hypothetical protein
VCRENHNSWTAGLLRSKSCIPSFRQPMELARSLTALFLSKWQHRKIPSHVFENSTRAATALVQPTSSGASQPLGNKTNHWAARPVGTRRPENPGVKTATRKGRRPGVAWRASQFGTRVFARRDERVLSTRGVVDSSAAPLDQWHGSRARPRPRPSRALPVTPAARIFYCRIQPRRDPIPRRCQRSLVLPVQQNRQRSALASGSRDQGRKISAPGSHDRGWNES